MAIFMTKRHTRGKKTVRGDARTGGCPQTEQGRQGLPTARTGLVQGVSPQPNRAGTGGVSPGLVAPLTEAALQQQLVIFYRNAYCLAHHRPRCLILSIPNEQKPNLIRTGLYPGGADLLVIHLTAVQSPAKGKKGAENTSFDGGIRMRVIFVEVKTPEGKVSPKQRKFEAHIKSMDGMVEYHICRSVEDFKKIIIN